MRIPRWPSSPTGATSATSCCPKSKPQKPRPNPKFRRSVVARLDSAGRRPKGRPLQIRLVISRTHVGHDGFLLGSGSGMEVSQVLAGSDSGTETFKVFEGSVIPAAFNFLVGYLMPAALS